MKFRLLASLVSLSLTLVGTSAFADDHPSNFAQYSVSMSGSPFGGSFNFGYNASEKTTYLFSLGGLPGLEMDQEIGGTDYTVDSSSAWMGAFVQHRPFDGAKWFRLAAGIGIGSIENELKDDAGNTFVADYNDNPVGYTGIGFGFEPVEGFIWGVDLGLLFGAGPDVGQTAGTPDLDAVNDIADHFLFGTVLPNIQVSLGWGF